MRIAVPFKIDQVYGGLGEAHGILSFDGERLCMEFQTRDAMFGILKAPIQSVTVDLEKVSSMEIRKGVFRSSLIILLSDFREAVKIPTSQAGEIRLRVAKKHYDELRTLDTEVRSVMTNRSLDELLAESQEFLAENSDSTDTLPPPPPPPV